uniref:Uncharacterized protein n=1 Tax=Aegilops tauschii TaxID=37682 RepID=M8D3K3_AEGTA
MAAAERTRSAAAPDSTRVTSMYTTALQLLDLSKKEYAACSSAAGLQRLDLTSA